MLASVIGSISSGKKSVFETLVEVTQFQMLGCNSYKRLLDGVGPNVIGTRKCIVMFLLFRETAEIKCLSI